MHRIFEIILLIFISTPGYCQCEDDQIIFVDSLGKEIDLVKANLIFIPHNGTDTLKLDQLYDPNFTHYVGSNSFEQVQFNALLENSATKNRTIALADTTKYCVSCNNERIKIIDSIDINMDGIKELFLFREWSCSAFPSNNNRFDNVGFQQQVYSQYEVWNVKSKEKIFEVQKRCESRLDITINVTKTVGYQINVDIDSVGSFYLSSPSEIGSKLEMGTYKYDIGTEKYIPHKNHAILK